MRELNARDRNPKVRYPAFLTNRGRWWTVCHCFARSSAAGTLQHCLPYVKQWHTLVRNAGYSIFPGTDGPLHKWLGDLDEVVDGKGDGVVSVRRGRLDGVEDTVVLKFGHAKAFRVPDTFHAAEPSP